MSIETSLEASQGYLPIDDPSGLHRESYCSGFNPTRPNIATKKWVNPPQYELIDSNTSQRETIRNLADNLFNRISQLPPSIRYGAAVISLLLGGAAYSQVNGDFDKAVEAEVLNNSESAQINQSDIQLNLGYYLAANLAVVDETEGLADNEIELAESAPVSSNDLALISGQDGNLEYVPINDLAEYGYNPNEINALAKGVFPISITYQKADGQELDVPRSGSMYLNKILYEDDEFIIAEGATVVHLVKDIAHMGSPISPIRHVQISGSNNVLVDIRYYKETAETNYNVADDFARIRVLAPKDVISNDDISTLENLDIDEIDEQELIGSEVMIIGYPSYVNGEELRNGHLIPLHEQNPVRVIIPGLEISRIVEHNNGMKGFVAEPKNPNLKFENVAGGSGGAGIINYKGKWYKLGTFFWAPQLDGNLALGIASPPPELDAYQNGVSTNGGVDLALLDKSYLSAIENGDSLNLDQLKAWMFRETPDFNIARDAVYRMIVMTEINGYEFVGANIDNENGLGYLTLQYQNSNGDLIANNYIYNIYSGAFYYVEN